MSARMPTHPLSRQGRDSARPHPEPTYARMGGSVHHVAARPHPAPTYSRTGAHGLVRPVAAHPHSRTPRARFASPAPIRSEPR